jgi:nicotinamide mononucleotide adenylyltransferase
LALLRLAFDPQKPTALSVGRYQQFHAGHQRLIEEDLRRVGQVCIAVRDTPWHRQHKSIAILRR